MPDETGSSSLGNEDHVDSYIAQALNTLSIKERDEVYSEMHGVNEVVDETPGLLQEKLQALDKALQTLKDTHPKAAAYRMAIANPVTYSLSNYDSPKLRIKFLRAESFNVAKAADRIILFYDLKLFLFGPCRLCEDITLDKLSKDDIASLNAGYIQQLPVRDRAGRAIQIFLSKFQKYAKPENMVSCCGVLSFEQ